MTSAKKKTVRKAKKPVSRKKKVPASSAPTIGPKYEFTGETKVVFGVTLKRIRALVAIASIGVSAGDLGGWIESDKNLSQVSGNAWVYGDARVYGNAQVYGDAWVSGNAWVYGDARVYGNAWVSGNAWVYGDAQVYGDAWVSGNAWVYGDAWVLKPIISATRTDGYTFVCAYREGQPPVIIAGCRYFTFAKAREHWLHTRGNTDLGKESLALVDHLERMAIIQGWCKEEAK